MKSRILVLGCTTLSAAAAFVAATAFVLAAPQESPRLAPRASEETLAALAQRGAYKFSFELIDSTGHSLASQRGICTRETFVVSPGITENPQTYEISVELLNSDDNDLLIRFEVAHRTEIKNEISLNGVPHGSETWRSENIRIIDTITVDEHQTFELDSLKDAEHRPVTLIVKIDQFRYPEK